MPRAISSPRSSSATTFATPGSSVSRRSRNTDAEGPFSSTVPDCSPRADRDLRLPGRSGAGAALDRGANDTGGNPAACRRALRSLSRPARRALSSARRAPLVVTSAMAITPLRVELEAEVPDPPQRLADTQHLAQFG